MSPFDPTSPARDIWARLRDYCKDGYDAKFPSLSDAQARELEQHGIFIPPSEYPNFTHIHNGMMARERPVCYPPTTEKQLRITEEILGFPLPPDLRLLYTEVSNGGIHLGPVEFFLGAIGGCGEYAATRPDGQTIEAFANQDGWDIHPRITEALLQHPGRYVIAGSLPKGCVWIGQDSEISVAIDLRSGYIYNSEWLGELIPDKPGDDSTNPSPLFFNQLTCISVAAPSLSTWFERWLDQRWDNPLRDHGELSPAMVATDDLPEPDVVWRGIFRPGLAKRLRSDEPQT